MSGPSSGRAGTQATGWVGWIAFAAIMMMMVGAFHVIQGLVALFNDEYYLVGKSGLVLSFDFTAWGWVHLLGGALIITAGVALFAGQTWARVVGVLLAVISALINISFLSAYPIWSVMMITIDILVIWALTVHGHEMRSV